MVVVGRWDEDGDDVGEVLMGSQVVLLRFHAVSWLGTRKCDILVKVSLRSREFRYSFHSYEQGPVEFFLPKIGQHYMSSSPTATAKATTPVLNTFSPDSLDAALVGFTPPAVVVAVGWSFSYSQGQQLTASASTSEVLTQL